MLPPSVRYSFYRSKAGESGQLRRRPPVLPPRGGQGRTRGGAGGQPPKPSPIWRSPFGKFRENNKMMSFPRGMLYVTGSQRGAYCESKRKNSPEDGC